MFVCAHCPYVVHVQPELARLARDFAGKSVGFVAITANDVARIPARMRRQKAPRWPAPPVGRSPFSTMNRRRWRNAYAAACTPDFFLFDAARKLVYRGQLDSSRPGRGSDRPGGGQLNGADIRAALDAVLSGQPVSPQQMPSIGCNIKWKHREQNRPTY